MKKLILIFAALTALVVPATASAWHRESVYEVKTNRFVLRHYPLSSFVTTECGRIRDHGTYGARWCHTLRDTGSVSYTATFYVIQTLSLRWDFYRQGRWQIGP